MQGRARFQQHPDASCHQVFFFTARQGAEEDQAILTETVASFLPGRDKDLSASLYVPERKFHDSTLYYVYYYHRSYTKCVKFYKLALKLSNF